GSVSRQSRRLLSDRMPRSRTAGHSDRVGGESEEGKRHAIHPPPDGWRVSEGRHERLAARSERARKEHETMGPGRLKGFTDGVLAIVITIMVLELRVPDEAGLASLRPLVPVVLSYLLSFVYLVIYWTN